MLNKCPVKDTRITWITEGLIIWKATHCIYPSFYTLSMIFPSWKQCAGSWFTVQLAYTYNWQKVGWALPENFSPTWMSRKIIPVWSQLSKACLSLKFFYCFSSSRELAGRCVLHFWPNTPSLNQACAFLPYAFVWTVLQLVWMLFISPYLSKEVPLTCRVVEQLIFLCLNRALSSWILCWLHWKKHHCSGCNWASHFTGLETAPRGFPSCF